MVDEPAVVRDLRTIGAPKIILRAAKHGYVRRVECTMRKCYCPGGRSRFHYLTRPLGPWMPSADHRQRKMDGGTRALKNMQLAHRLCNYVDYAKEAQISFDRFLARASAEWWTGTALNRTAGQG
jgi:hypothetical protein